MDPNSIVPGAIKTDVNALKDELNKMKHDMTRVKTQNIQTQILLSEILNKFNSMSLQSSRIITNPNAPKFPPTINFQDSNPNSIPVTRRYDHIPVLKLHIDLYYGIINNSFTDQMFQDFKQTITFCLRQGNLVPNNLDFTRFCEKTFTIESVKYKNAIAYQYLYNGQLCDLKYAQGSYFYSLLYKIPIDSIFKLSQYPIELGEILTYLSILHGIRFIEVADFNEQSYTLIAKFNKDPLGYPIPYDLFSLPNYHWRGSFKQYGNQLFEPEIFWYPITEESISKVYGTTNEANQTIIGYSRIRNIESCFLLPEIYQLDWDNEIMRAIKDVNLSKMVLCAPKEAVDLVLSLSKGVDGNRRQLRFLGEPYSLEYIKQYEIIDPKYKYFMIYSNVIMGQYVSPEVFKDGENVGELLFNAMQPFYNHIINAKQLQI